VDQKFAEHLDDLKIHYQLLDNGLFQASKKTNVKGIKRLGLRFDFAFPHVNKNDIADWYWNTFVNSAEDQYRLFGVEKFDLKRIDGPDPDTQLVYNYKKWENKKDQGTVFLCNRKEETLLRSTLAPPGEWEEALDEESKRKSPEMFGKVKANVVAMTATHSTLEAMRSYGSGLAGDIPDDVNHITSVVIQGAACYETDGVCHLVNVMSYPENYRIIDMGHSDCIKDGRMTDAFAQLLVNMTKEMEKDLAKLMVHKHAD